MCCAAFKKCCGIFQPEKTPTFQYFIWRGSPDSFVLGKKTETGVAINSLMNRDYVLILGTMMEEFAHYVSGASDFSRQLVSCLVDNMARYVIKEKTNEA